MPISLEQQQLFSSTVQTIDLLQSIFFNETEFQFVEEEDKQLYEQLKNWDETDGWPNNDNNIPKFTSLQFIIRAPVDSGSEEVALYITLNCALSLTSGTEYQLTLPSAANGWLSRADHQTLSASLSDHVVDEPPEDRSAGIVEKIQHAQQIAEMYVEKWCNQEKEKQAAAIAANSAKSGPVRFLREWIWFPMIYTKNKRGDIIDWAPQYQITGFLCPGKPGALCLEGPEKNVSQFINDIKTISWANIPPAHKKMTSRWKEVVDDCQNDTELDSHRIFPDMQEVKFDIHGQFANHNNLSMLQDWLREKGCEEAFERLFEFDN